MIKSDVNLNAFNISGLQKENPVSLYWSMLDDALQHVPLTLYSPFLGTFP